MGDKADTQDQPCRATGTRSHGLLQALLELSVTTPHMWCLVTETQQSWAMWFRGKTAESGRAATKNNAGLLKAKRGKEEEETERRNLVPDSSKLKIRGIKITPQQG